MSAPNLHMSMRNRPENVALIREALSGLTDQLGVERTQLDDIKTAVSEAANNVVLHAYDGGEGPLEIDALVGEHTLEIVVRDHGNGIRPRAQPQPDSVQGIGLSVIQALADGAEFLGGPGEGTEVRMTFNLDNSVAHLPASVLLALDGSAPPGDLVVSVAPAALVAGVLGRVAAVLAARAHFSIDRLSDAQLVTDVFASRAASSSAFAHVTVGFETGPRRLDLRLGPLANGYGERLVQSTAVPGIGSMLAKLADELVTEELNGSDVLHVVLLEPDHAA